MTTNEITAADREYHDRRMEHFGLKGAADDVIEDYWAKLAADTQRQLGLGQAIERDFFYKTLAVERLRRGMVP